jgi:hypothetical protein
MNIHILKVPSSEQRYDTLGDWYFDAAGDLIIKVSNDVPEMPTDDHQNLIALHELVEVLLCRKRLITQKQVDDFDFAAEDCEGEPGDLPDAPYRKEHRFAMMIEHLMAHELGVENYGVVV